MQNRLGIALTGVLVSSGASCAKAPPSKAPARGPGVLATSAPTHAVVPEGIPFAVRVQYLLDRPDEERWALFAWTHIAGGTLYINEGNQRWFYTPTDHAMTPATTLLPEQVFAVAHMAGELRMIAATGEIFSAKTLLGPITRRPSIPARVTTAAIGREAMVVVTSNSRVLRSMDVGVTWLPVAGAPAAAFEYVVLDERGHGLAIDGADLYVSFDDGATWRREQSPSAAVKSPVIGNAADGRVVLYTEHCDGTGYDLANGPTPLVRAKQLAWPSKDPVDPGFWEREWRCAKICHWAWTGVSRALGGKRVLELRATKSGEWSTAVADVGVVGTRELRPELKSCDRTFDPMVVGSGDAFAIACHTGKVEDVVITSADAGKTWQVQQLPLPPKHIVTDIVVGPNGFLMLVPFCSHGDCLPPLVRTTPNGAFVEATWKTQQQAFAFSPQRSRIYALAHSDKGLQLVTAKLGEAKFVSRPMWLAASTDMPQSLTIASNGDLLAAFYHNDHWTIARSADDGLNWTTAKLTFAASAIAISGDRALAAEPLFAASSTSRGGWESADGGKTWSAVDLPTLFRDVACGPNGCTSARGVRVGWEL